jgi:hypothetical protein
MCLADDERATMPLQGLLLFAFLYLHYDRPCGSFPSITQVALSHHGGCETSSSISALLYQSSQSTKGLLQDHARSTNRLAKCAINGWLQPKVDATVPQTRACTKALRLDR